MRLKFKTMIVSLPQREEGAQCSATPDGRREFSAISMRSPASKRAPSRSYVEVRLLLRSVRFARHPGPSGSQSVPSAQQVW